jgi:hypothetical protein
MDIERWDIWEIDLNSSRDYNNPFQDVELIGTFIHKETGKSVTVNGFYDGNSTWRIRFMPYEIGEWHYKTQSNDPDISGKEGQIVCVKPTKSYLHGPLKAKDYHFFHADETPKFLISTRMSCVYSDPNVWAEIIDFIKEYRINRVLFMMGGVAGTIKELYGNGLDFWRYNIEKFRSIDAFIDALRKASIIASPYFYYFNDGIQRNLTPDQDKAFIKYGMARFGAYNNVMPVLSNEVEQKLTGRKDEKYDLTSHKWANEMGVYLSKLAVFDVPIAVHNPMETEKAVSPGFYSLLRDWQFPWADLMLRQAQVAALSTAPQLNDDIPEQKEPTYNIRGYSRHNQLLIDLRRFGIPVINEEPGYEMEGHSADPNSQKINLMPWNSQTSDTLISTFWSATMAGAYAMWGHYSTYEMSNPINGMKMSITPKYLKILYDLVTELPYWEMKPANEAVSSNEVMFDGVPYRTNFCLAKISEVYLVFSLNGGQTTLYLSKDSKYKVTQIDPRSGEKTELGIIESGECIINVIGKEQVLLIIK